VIYAPEDSGNLIEIQASAHDHGHRHNHDPEAPRTASQECEAGDELAHEEVKVGKKRQVVGILVSHFAAYCVGSSLKPYRSYNWASCFIRLLLA
jgi:hypothetical protein